MISDVYTIWLREMIRYVRAKSRIITSLAMPIIWLALLGTALGSMMESSPLLPPGMNYVQFIAPGIIGMAILFTSIFSGISIIFDRELYQRLFETSRSHNRKFRPRGNWAF